MMIAILHCRSAARAPPSAASPPMGYDRACGREMNKPDPDGENEWDTIRDMRKDRALRRSSPARVLSNSQRRRAQLEHPPRRRRQKQLHRAAPAARMNDRHIHKQIGTPHRCGVRVVLLPYARAGPAACYAPAWQSCCLLLPPPACMVGGRSEPLIIISSSSSSGGRASGVEAAAAAQREDHHPAGQRGAQVPRRAAQRHRGAGVRPCPGTQPNSRTFELPNSRTLCRTRCRSSAQPRHRSAASAAASAESSALLIIRSAIARPASSTAC